MRFKIVYVYFKNFYQENFIKLRENITILSGKEQEIATLNEKLQEKSSELTDLNEKLQENYSNLTEKEREMKILNEKLVNQATINSEKEQEIKEKAIEKLSALGLTVEDLKALGIG